VLNAPLPSANDETPVAQAIVLEALNRASALAAAGNYDGAKAAAQAATRLLAVLARRVS